jgi:hypothetical protein
VKLVTQHLSAVTRRSSRFSPVLEGPVSPTVSPSGSVSPGSFSASLPDTREAVPHPLPFTSFRDDGVQVPFLDYIDPALLTQGPSFFVEDP